MIWDFRFSLFSARRSRGERLVCKPEKRRKAVLDFIRSAHRSLLLSVFRCDDTEVLCELGRAVQRGVDVHILLTARAKGWGKRLGPLGGLLETLGVQVHRFSDDSMKYHAKYMVADGELALIATMNLTRRCFRRTRDFVLVTGDREVAIGLQALFWADVSGSPVPTLPDRLILGPEHARGRIEGLLRNSRRSIRVIDHKLADPSILGVLLDRSADGVSVDVDAGSMEEGLEPHGRAIVVDSETAVVGSFSLTEQSLGRRRELAIILTDPKCVEKLERKFYSGGSPKVLGRAA